MASVTSAVVASSLIRHCLCSCRSLPAVPRGFLSCSHHQGSRLRLRSMRSALPSSRSPTAPGLPWSSLCSLPSAHRLLHPGRRRHSCAASTASFSACTLPGRSPSTSFRMFSLMKSIVACTSALKASVLSSVFSACIASLRLSRALTTAVADALSGSSSSACAVSIALVQCFIIRTKRIGLIDHVLQCLDRRCARLDLQGIHRGI